MRDPARDPPRERSFRTHRLRTHPDPSVHLATAHHDTLDVVFGDERFGVLGRDPDHQPAATADAYRHVAADQEREAAEHPLLRHALLGYQFANSVREVLVVSHS